MFLLCVVAYAMFNVTLMLMYAKNMLGPVPFGLIFKLLGVSVFGVIAVFPMQLALRRVGVTWRSGLAAVLCFIALAAFNYWCLCAAAAAA